MSEAQKPNSAVPTGAEDAARAAEAEARVSAAAAASKANADKAAADRALLEARDSERARMSSILSHPEAVGREKMAKDLALTTSYSVEESARLLAMAPKGGSTNQFASAMAAVPNPQVGADGAGAGDRPGPKVINTAEIYKFHREQEAAARAAARQKR